jgi:flavin reductase (DIM6/NTAB) family NADH-FMN oxidoreductase RutF
MAAEWTRVVSYTPSLIMVHVDPAHASTKNIKKSKEFGVSLASESQNWVSSIAGGSHGNKVDKISALKDLGVVFYEAKKIDALMVKDAAFNAECKLVKTITLGDHYAFIGKVVAFSMDESINPLLYHEGKYFKLGEHIEKPPQEFLDKIKAALEKHSR